MTSKPFIEVLRAELIKRGWREEPLRERRHQTRWRHWDGYYAMSLNQAVIQQLVMDARREQERT